MSKQNKDEKQEPARDTAANIPFQVLAIAGNVMLRMSFQNQGKVGPEQVTFGNDYATAAPIFKGKNGVEVVWHRNYSTANLNKSMKEGAQKRYQQCKTQYEGRKKWLEQNPNIDPAKKDQMEEFIKQAESELLTAEIELEEANKKHSTPDTVRYEWFEGQEFAAL